MSQFENDLKDFNTMYKMPVAGTPSIISAQRLRDFKSILSKELDEIDDIIAALDGREEAVERGSETDPQQDLTALTDLADLLGDLQVYCGSEMLKWGLPVDATLAIIMQSNFSKMGADGKPIYDEQGKLQKGPKFYKPEPQLRLLLAEREVLAQAADISRLASELHEKAAVIQRDRLNLRYCPPASLEPVQG